MGLVGYPGIGAVECLQSALSNVDVALIDAEHPARMMAEVLQRIRGVFVNLPGVEEDRCEGLLKGSKY